MARAYLRVSALVALTGVFPMADSNTTHRNTKRLVTTFIVIATPFRARGPGRRCFAVARGDSEVAAVHGVCLWGLLNAVTKWGVGFGPPLAAGGTLFFWLLVVGFDAATVFCP